MKFTVNNLFFLSFCSLFCYRVLRKKRSIDFQEVLEDEKLEEVIYQFFFTTPIRRVYESSFVNLFPQICFLITGQ